MSSKRSAVYSMRWLKIWILIKINVIYVNTAITLNTLIRQILLVRVVCGSDLLEKHGGAVMESQKRISNRKESYEEERTN